MFRKLRAATSSGTNSANTLLSLTLTETTKSTLGIIPRLLTQPIKSTETQYPTASHEGSYRPTTHHSITSNLPQLSISLIFATSTSRYNLQLSTSSTLKPPLHIQYCTLWVHPGRNCLLAIIDLLSCTQSSSSSDQRTRMHAYDSGMLMRERGEGGRERGQESEGRGGGGGTAGMQGQGS